jgi:hypothetical protein
LAFVKKVTLREMTARALERHAEVMHHRKRKNYAGSKTLPVSVKDKEAHWPELP